MPLPPPVLEETNGDGSTTETEIRLEFTFVESLIFAFHQLARQHREFLTDNADRSKDFRSRYVLITNDLSELSHNIKIFILADYNILLEECKAT